MFSRTAEELPRINNNVKAWHKSFQANASFTHSTFWKFLDVLLREEPIVRVRIFEIRARHAPELQRRRYADCNTCRNQTGKLWTIYDTLLITFLFKILYRTSHAGLFWKKGILKI